MLNNDVEKYVRGCPSCQANKIHRYKPKAPLHPINPGNTPFINISLDLIAPLPKSNRYNAVLVIVDRATKKAVFVPTHDTLTSEGFAKLLIEHWIRHFGLPKTVISDCRPQFVNKFIDSFYEACGIQGTPPTAYHPQTDGQTEHVNQELETYLHPYVNSIQKNWAKFLPLAEFSYTIKDWLSGHLSVLGLFSTRRHNKSNKKPCGDL